MKELCLTTQMDIFGFLDSNNETEIKSEDNAFSFTDEDKARLDDYALEDYCADVHSSGLRDVWNKINYYTLNYGNENDF